jgi:hypothetical protein
VVQVKKVLSGQEYEEPLPVPGAAREVLEAAVKEAVQTGKVWLLAGAASILRDEVPAGILTDDARLATPPAPISLVDLMPESLPEAWSGGTTTPAAITDALSARWNRPLPWSVVREAVEGAYRAGLVDISGPMPSRFAEAKNVVLTIASGGNGGHSPVTGAGTTVRAWRAEATLRPAEIQNLAESVGDIVNVATEHGVNITFRLNMEIDGEPTPQAVQALNGVLSDVTASLRLEEG